MTVITARPAAELVASDSATEMLRVRGARPTRGQYRLAGDGRTLEM
jgi:hypothetical protein